MCERPSLSVPCEVAADIKGHADTVWSAIRQALGAGALGQPVDARGLTGQRPPVSSASPRSRID